jgi:hypothetical protein
MMSKHRRLRRSSSGAINQREVIDLLSWTLQHRRILVPGRPFDLTHHRYLVDLYNCTAQRMCASKAGQMGLSEYLVSYALHAADQRDATCLYVFPTDTHVSDFSSARIGPAIEASPYLGGIIVDARAEGGKSGADRVTLKRVRDRFLYLRGAQVKPDGSAPQLKSIDADVLILDELDEMDPRAPEIARKRLGASQLGEERIVSTPTYSGAGIHAQFAESDQREWHVRCEACGEWQPMTINAIVQEWDSLGRPTRWNGKSEGHAFVACRKCGAGLDRLGPGRWVATYPGRDVAGFHLSRLFGATADLDAIVATLGSTNETRRRECYNQDLGEPYTPRGGQLTDDLLDACRREYAHGVVLKERTVMGVDVGKVLHCVIRGPAHPEMGEPSENHKGERPQRWAGAVESFEEVGRMMRRFSVGTLVIDALPETKKARELQASFPEGAVWLAYYATQKVGSKKTESLQWVGEETVAGARAWNGVVNMDRTRTLDEMFGEFFEGRATLPANARDVPEYYSHLKAPVRVLEDGPGGQKIAAYVESSPDHLAHAENYCLAARAAPRVAPVSVPARVVSRDAVRAMMS